VKPEFREMAEKLEYIDEGVVTKFLKLYLSKCKFKHAFAFL
jgi:hypothetical protein